MSVETSEGMLSLTREINPKIPTLLEDQINKCAVMAFQTVGGTGAPRVDFLSNEKTGEIWLNEINPCPGSFAYFLWESAEQPMMFVELLTKLIEEAIELHQATQLPDDPTPIEARILPGH